MCLASTSGLRLEARHRVSIKTKEWVGVPALAGPDRLKPGLQPISFSFPRSARERGLSYLAFFNST